MAVITSNASGNWSAGGTWVGGVAPASGDSAVIANTHVVDIDGNITVGPASGLDPNPTSDCSVYIQTGGTLRVPHTVAGNYTLTLRGPIYVATGGTFTIGTDSDNPIPSNRTFDILFDDITVNNWIAGSFKIYGYPSYHMADADSYRSRIDTDAGAGAGATLSLPDSVDWQSGDTVLVGTGGDPGHAITGVEKVTLTGKTDASTFTANLGSNHFGDANYGDVLVNITRNVNIDIGGAYQYQFANRDSTVSFVRDAEFDLNWCCFSNGGRSTEALFEFGLLNARYAADKVSFNHVCFDTIRSATVPWINIENCGIDPADGYQFTDLVFYDSYICIRVQDGTGWRINGITSIDANSTHLNSINTTLDSTGIEEVLNAWFVYDGIVFDDIMPSLVTNFKIHGVDYFANVSSTTSSDNQRKSKWDTGEIFALQNVAGTLIGTGSDNPLNWFFKDVEWKSCLGHCLNYNACSGTSVFEFVGCSFDGNNTGNNNARAAIAINQAPGSSLIFRSCNFGTTTQNYRWNTIFNTHPRGALSRLLFSNCVIKEPANWSPTTTYDWYGDGDRERLWALGLNSYQSQYDRMQLGINGSYELVDCQLLNAADADQWSTLYPNTDSVAFIHGGGEMHKVSSGEAAGYQDGTYARKFLPFNPGMRTYATYARPLLIPLTSGEQITVTLDFKKNLAVQSDFRLPKLHMEGCGISTLDTMQDIQNTWDTLTVTGTASYTDVVRVTVSCWAMVDDSYILSADNPTRQATTSTVGAYNYPYDPGDSDNLILYCDKLTVTIS